MGHTSPSKKLSRSWEAMKLMQPALGGVSQGEKQGPATGLTTSRKPKGEDGSCSGSLTLLAPALDPQFPAAAGVGRSLRSLPSSYLQAW